METTIIANAIRPKAGSSPKKGTKFHDHTLHFAHEIIKGSQYRQILSRWHWAILEKVERYYNPRDGMADDEAKAIEKNAIKLAEGVWIKYYTGNEDPSRNKKRTLGDVEESEEFGDDGFAKRPCTKKPVSIKEMADAGLGFKLDWNSQDKDVAVLERPEDGDVVMTGLEALPSGSKDGEADDEEDGDGGLDLDLEKSDCFGYRKETRRLTRSPHSLRKKLLRKLLMSARPGAV
ncbi:hypothetical protein TWF718_010424 [Orbilia javanica]|uniref:Uncharacterized protein n=1 Tax=Orbilia javanica TaxID=47235 RepID=A0AAN8MYB3_9PEZI